ncbi:hypothetical protein FQA39_LY13246 [Lamprigera yunnana]|nr:hypothetical protein FQA39_LY13246 [Lamprigera yunnana]
MYIIDSKNVTKVLLIIACSSVWFGNGQKLDFSDWDNDHGSTESVKILDMLLQKPLCTSNSIESCEDDRNPFIYNMLKKRKEHLTPVYVASKSSKSIRAPPLFYNKGLSCSCIMEPRMHDLGIMYFPRRIPTAVCKTGSCLGGPYQCRPKQYKIQVLKQKELEDLNRAEVTSYGVPRGLRDDFVSETVTVIVACECLP